LAWTSRLPVETQGAAAVSVIRIRNFRIWQVHFHKAIDTSSQPVFLARLLLLTCDHRNSLAFFIIILLD
jgi:hypothetical protein